MQGEILGLRAKYALPGSTLIGRQDTWYLEAKKLGGFHGLLGECPTKISNPKTSLTLRIKDMVCNLAICAWDGEASSKPTSITIDAESKCMPFVECCFTEDQN